MNIPTDVLKKKLAISTYTNIINTIFIVLLNVIDAHFNIVQSSAIRFQRPQKVIDSSRLTNYNTDLLSLYIFGKYIIAQQYREYTVII